nr:hypothetical protein [Tanacetum cinerariifolium]
KTQLANARIKGATGIRDAAIQERSFLSPDENTLLSLIRLLTAQEELQNLTGIKTKTESLVWNDALHIDKTHKGFFPMNRSNNEYLGQKLIITIHVNPYFKKSNDPPNSRNALKECDGSPLYGSKWRTISRPLLNNPAVMLFCALIYCYFCHIFDSNCTNYVFQFEFITLGNTYIEHENGKTYSRMARKSAADGDICSPTTTLVAFISSFNKVLRRFPWGFRIVTFIDSQGAKHDYVDAGNMLSESFLDSMSIKVSTYPVKTSPSLDGTIM